MPADGIRPINELTLASNSSGVADSIKEIEEFQKDETYIKNLILERLKVRLAKTKVTSVLLSSGFDNEQSTQILNLGLP